MFKNLDCYLETFSLFAIIILLGACEQLTQTSSTQTEKQITKVSGLNGDFLS